MKKIIILFAAITAISFFSCSDESDEKNENVDFIELSSNTLTVGEKGGDATITVKSSSDWRIAGFSEWVTLSTTEGKNGDEVTFTVAPNSKEESQEAVYKFFTGSVVQKLVITSNPKLDLSLISDADLSLESNATTQTIIFESNISDLVYKFTNDGEKWITPVETKEAFGKKLVILDITKNETYNPRETKFSIEGEDKKVEVTINQEPTRAILSDKTDYIYDLMERDIQLSIKTNVEYEVRNLPEWMTITNTQKGETGTDGLQEHILTIHLQNATSSRKEELSFIYMNSTLLKMSIKQQNPNPTLITIPDLQFRQALSKAGWVMLGSDENIECELLDLGTTAKKLDISGSSSYYKNGVTSLEGIENFPQIETLNVKYNKISVFDISKLTNVKSVEVIGNGELSIIQLGNNPITSLNLEEAFEPSTSLTISGKQLTELRAGYRAWWYGDDTLEELDITGCPNLKKGYISRNYLQTLYITAAQKESAEIQTYENTNIIVK